MGDGGWQTQYGTNSWHHLTSPPMVSRNQMNWVGALHALFYFAVDSARQGEGIFLLASYLPSYTLMRSVKRRGGSLCFGSCLLPLLRTLPLCTLPHLCTAARLLLSATPALHTTPPHTRCAPSPLFLLPHTLRITCRIAHILRALLPWITRYHPDLVGRTLWTRGAWIDIVAGSGPGAHLRLYLPRNVSSVAWTSDGMLLSSHAHTTRTTAAHHTAHCTGTHAHVNFHAPHSTPATYS